MATPTETVPPNSVLVRSYLSSLKEASISLNGEVAALSVYISKQNGPVDQQQLIRIRELLNSIKAATGDASDMIEELTGRRQRRVILDEYDY